VFASGAAGLSWEVLWQHHATLALGASALGTAITLCCTMGGLMLGALAMGRLSPRLAAVRPLRLYGALEFVIGVSGLALAPGFAWLEHIDRWLYLRVPAAALVAHVAGIALVLGPPTMAMGASIPVFRLIATQGTGRVAVLYGLNTLGAAAGVLATAFVWLPALGVDTTTSFTVTLNLAVATLALLLREAAPAPAAAPAPVATPAQLDARELWVVAGTGMATFMLEVAWFRSLRAAFQSTTDSFAIVLAAVLLPLGVAAHLARRGPRTRERLGLVLVAAGVVALLVTPLIERFDRLDLHAGSYLRLVLFRGGLSMAVLGAPMVPLGVALPWLLDRRAEPRTAARLYGMNTAGSVAGALAAAWWLLPHIGAVRTAWLAGLLVVALGLALAAASRRVPVLLASAAALAVAVSAESGVGRLRVQAAQLSQLHRVLATQEGPDATVSVIDDRGSRELVIDGFLTSGQARQAHYMAWMGHLPMIAHPHPERALVICFGTGQTAHAVRQEAPNALDIVELSPAVLAMAPLFDSNHDVLADPRVRAIHMDGRAWLRRTDAMYDVVTLEPMAPHFAGSNALYDREFYQLVARRLRPGGVVAQWLPFLITPPLDATSVAATFRETFPDARLWIDPVDRTGVLIGRRAGEAAGDDWPGLARALPGRDLSPALVRANVALDAEGVARYAELGRVITDDNQLLAYGRGRRDMWRFGGIERMHAANLALVKRVRDDVAATRAEARHVAAP
jgi:predicted membrane-bound spermidine synthase